MRRALFAAILVVVAACSGGDGDDATPPPTGGSNGPTSVTFEDTVTMPAVGNSSNTEWDQVMFRAIDDVQSYWDEAYPQAYGEAWQDISGGFWPYTADSEPPPCGNPPPSYVDIADNAFYCPSADLVAWDSQQLVPSMFEQFGPFSLGLVMAHEIGHAVQARYGYQGPTITGEQQADCFAGSWTAWAADNSSAFDISLDDLDLAVAGFLQLGDAPGSVSSDPAAHGSAFDRIGAYEDGFLNGVEKCATYATNPPPTFQLPFSSQEEFDTGGNLPFGQVEALIVSDLETWWGLVFPEVFGLEWTPVSGAIPFDPENGPACGGQTFEPEQYENAAFYCVADDYVAWDEVNLMPALYDNIGDFAQGEVVANQYSLAVQVRLGITENSIDANLQADCLTGTWAASLVPGVRSSFGLEETLTISPGDLDEAVTAFLAFGDSAADVDAGTGVNGTAFQRIAAFRDGFLNGVSNCAAYLG